MTQPAPFGYGLDLPDDVKEELEDPEFLTRQHYSRSTYALGCHGPLCKKAERDRGRRRSEQKAAREGRTYTPNMTIRETERDEQLDQIISWHLMWIKRADWERVSS